MTVTPVPAFHLRDVTKTFGRATALNAVTCDIPLGHVHGLIGRNGAGKTTLLRTLAGQIRVSGTLTLDDTSGEASPVWDNPGVLDHLVLAGADVPYPPDMSVRALTDIAAARWTTWDAVFADDLLDRFGLNPKARFSGLSRGQKTLVSLVIGLGVRAQVTLLDEPYLGLDVQNRDLLYRVLLDEITAAPSRTWIVSTHHVEDAALLLDSVILIDAGRVTEVRPVEDLTRGTAVVEGAAPAVASLLADGRFPVLREDAAAGRRRVTLDTSVVDADLGALVHDLGLRLREPDLEHAVLARGTRGAGDAPGARDGGL